MPICWMCEKQEATTGEHIFKHSILKEMYGRGRLAKGNRLIVRMEKTHSGGITSSKTPIDSTNSDIFKFKKSLCALCNGGKSRAWDDEFDYLMRYLFENRKLLYSKKILNINNIRPKNSKNGAHNLYCYFCKLLGCLLFTHNQAIPKEIKKALCGFNYSNHLGINIVFAENLKDIAEPKDFLVNHDLVGDASDEINYRWALGFGDIKLGFWFKTPKRFVIGDLWYGKSKRIPITCTSLDI